MHSLERAISDCEKDLSGSVQDSARNKSENMACYEYEESLNVGEKKLLGGRGTRGQSTRRNRFTRGGSVAA